MVSFFICWLPFHAQRLLASYLFKYNEESSANQVLLDICQKLTYISGVMYYLSSTINPLLYQLMSAKFRLAFKETFKCSPFQCLSLCRKQHSSPHHSGSQSTYLHYRNPTIGSGSPSNSIRFHKPPSSPCPPSTAYSGCCEPSSNFESVSYQAHNFQIPIDGSAWLRGVSKGSRPSQLGGSIRLLARRLGRPLIRLVSGSSTDVGNARSAATHCDCCCCQLSSRPDTSGQQSGATSDKAEQDNNTLTDDEREPDNRSRSNKSPLLPSGSNLNDGASFRACLTRLSSRDDEENEEGQQDQQDQGRAASENIRANRIDNMEPQSQFQRLIQPFDDSNENQGCATSGSSGNPSSSSSRSPSASSPEQQRHSATASSKARVASRPQPHANKPHNGIREQVLRSKPARHRAELSKQRRNSFQSTREPLSINNGSQLVSLKKDIDRSCDAKRRKFSSSSNRYLQASSSFSSSERHLDDKRKLSHSSTTSALDCTSYTTTNSHLTATTTAATNSNPQINSAVGSLTQTDSCPLNGLDSLDGNPTRSIVINPIPSLRADDINKLSELDEFGVPLLSSQ